MAHHWKTNLHVLIDFREQMLLYHVKTCIASETSCPFTSFSAPFSQMNHGHKPLKAIRLPWECSYFCCINPYHNWKQVLPLISLRYYCSLYFIVNASGMAQPKFIPSLPLILASCRFQFTSFRSNFGPLNLVLLVSRQKFGKQRQKVP